MRLIDTHTHLDFPDFDADRDGVLARSRVLGVERLVVLGVYQANWQRLWDLVQAEDGLHAAFGLHPVYLGQHLPEHLLQLPCLIQERLVLCFRDDEGIRCETGRTSCEQCDFRRFRDDLFL